MQMQLQRTAGAAILAAVLTAALAVVGGPANAGTRTVRDASHDAHASIDINNARFEFGARKLVVKVRMARRSDVTVQANIDLGRKDVGGKFFLGASRDGDEMDVYLAYARRPGGGGPHRRCAGDEASYQPSNRTVRLEVPVRCLRKFEAVRRHAWIGAVAYSGAGLDSAPGDADNRPAYVKVRRG